MTAVIWWTSWPTAVARFPRMAAPSRLCAGRRRCAAMRRSAPHRLRQRPRCGGHPDSDAWTYGDSNSPHWPTTSRIGAGRSTRPADGKRWLRWEDVADAFVGRPDPDWEHDRNLIDQSVVNPWERLP